MSALTPMFRSPEILDTLREVDSRTLDQQVNGPQPAPGQIRPMERLRVAAITSFTEMFAEHTLDGWLRSNARDPIASKETIDECFFHWQGYLTALSGFDEAPNPDDLLSFAVAGFMAGKPHEVRDALRRVKCRLWLDQFRERLSTLPWVERVRSCITVSTHLRPLWLPSSEFPARLLRQWVSSIGSVLVL